MQRKILVAWIDFAGFFFLFFSFSPFPEHKAFIFYFYGFLNSIAQFRSLNKGNWAGCLMHDFVSSCLCRMMCFIPWISLGIYPNIGREETWQCKSKWSGDPDYLRSSVNIAMVTKWSHNCSFDYIMSPSTTETLPHGSRWKGGVHPHHYETV